MKIMPRKLLLAILLVSACGAQIVAGQAPVYKLLYSPPALGTPGGQPTVMFEGAPGVFYGLSVLIESTFGGSVFTITVGPK